MYITEMFRDSQLKNQLPTFLAKATENADALGLSPEEIENLTENIATVIEAMNDATAAKWNARAAVTAKNEAVEIIRKQISSLSQTWRANAEITDALLAEVNVPPHPTRGSRVPPTPPAVPAYRMLSPDMIRLTWHRNGNKNGTVFNVETSRSGIDDWRVAAITTKAKVMLPCNPGDALYIRVRAMRGDAVSRPSGMIALWTSDRAVSLENAA